MELEYTKIFKHLRPYLMTSSDNLSSFDPELVKQCLIFDPLKLESSSFIEKVLKMDALCFGEGQMAMDKWVLLDCAMMPGAVVGFYIECSHLSVKDREVLGVAEKDIFPLSMYIAIPSIKNEGTWFGHNLSSLNGKVELSLRGLGQQTKLLGQYLLQIKTQQGATQWDSPSIHIHLKFGGMKILSAWTPAHSHPKTLVYETLKNFIPSKTFEISGEKEELIELQRRVESGENFVLIEKKEKSYVIGK